MFILLVVILIAGILMALLMQPKRNNPPDARALEAPSVKIGEPVLILFGTRKIESPKIAFLGDILIKKEKVAGGGKKG